jgi:glucosylceramidase
MGFFFNKGLGFVLVSLLIALPGLVSLGSCDGSDPDPKPPPPPPQEEIGKASWWLTKGDQSILLAKQSDISIYAVKETSLPIITITPATAYQEIEGFGAALTGSSAYLINKKMSSSQRNALLQDLFNTSSGIGISSLRLTIGSSDFSLKNFTYDDMPSGETDYALSNFTLQEDKADVIPVMKAINTISSDVTVIASPWSPPAWMKTNTSLIGGSLKTDAYEVYANYFVKYINGMEDEGIIIDAVTLQNEPLYEAPYPSMSMTATEQKNFIKNNVGPLFAANSITTKIIVYDHNWDNTDYAISIMNDATAKGYVTGSAFHAYGGNVSAMSLVHNAHPDRGLYFTEISGGEWATDFASNLQWNMANIFIGTTKNWSKTALLWNLALDENHGPKNNGCSDCRGVVTINSSTGNVTKNVEYYSIGHFSKFIRNGAHRVASSTSTGIPGVDHVAFLNTDGKRVVVFSNSGSSEQAFMVREGEQQFTVTIPASSVITITF